MAKKAEKREQRKKARRTRSESPTADPKHTESGVPISEYVVVTTDTFESHLRDWIVFQSRSAAKVMDLVKEVRRDPRSGTGQPERLKHYEEEIWSRHVTQGDRLTYLIEGGTITLLACRGHYDDR